MREKIEGVTFHMNSGVEGEAQITLTDDKVLGLHVKSDGGAWQLYAEARIPGAGAKLSRIAFNAGAMRVKHDYDLAIDEIRTARVK